MHRPDQRCVRPNRVRMGGPHSAADRHGEWLIEASPARATYDCASLPRDFSIVVRRSAMLML